MNRSFLYIDKSPWGYSVWQVGCGWWHRLWSGWDSFPTLESALNWANEFCRHPAPGMTWEVLPKSRLPDWFHAGSNNPQEF